MKRMLKRIERETRRFVLAKRLEKSLSVNGFVPPVEAELKRLASAMGIPRPVAERAGVLYKRAIERVRGCSPEALAAAALYMACRMAKMPRLLDEFASYTKASIVEVARCYRLMLRELNVKVPPADPALYVLRAAKQLNLDGEVVRRAIDLIQKAKKVVRGRKPTSVAAAALYLVTSLSQSDVSKTLGVSDGAVRDAARLLAQFL